MADSIRKALDDAVKKSREELEAFEIAKRFVRLPNPDDEAGKLRFFLATKLLQRSRQTGTIEGLDEAIQLYHRTLQLLSPNHRKRYEVLNNLASALEFRYQLKGDQQNLDQVIAFGKNALQLWPSDDPNKDGCLNALAIALHTRFLSKGKEEDLEEAIGFHEQALHLGHSCQYSHLITYAAVLQSRYHLKCDKQDLDQAITMYKKALQFLPTGHPCQSNIFTILANALHIRYNGTDSSEQIPSSQHIDQGVQRAKPCHEHIGNEQDLSEAISYRKKALQLQSPDDPQQGNALYILANTLQSYYNLKGNEQDLDEVIDFHRKALQLRLARDSVRASSLTDLAGALQNRYDIKSNDQDLNEAIDLLKEALQIWPHDHHNRGISYDNLAKALHARYEHKGNTHDLLQAIEFHQTALELQPTGHSGRIVSLNSFASTLYSYYKVIKDEKILEKAIACQQEALRSHPSNDPFRTGLLANMAVYIESRTNPDEQGLNKAIDFYTHILHAHHITRIDRSIYSNGLANALKSRHKLKGNQEDLDQAIVVLRDAIQNLPFGHPARGGCLNNLANFLRLQYQQTQELKHAIESIDIFEQSSVDPDCGALQKVHLAYDWAMFASQINHESALKAYTNVFTALETFLLIAPTLKDQYMALAEYANLGVYAASHAFNLNQHQFALKFLEQGRALLWSQVRHFKVHSDLVEKHPLIQQYLQVAKSLETLATSKQSYHSENTFDDYLGAMYKQKEDLDQTRKTLIGQIQQSPGYENFMKLPSYAILQSVATEGPVVVINCSHNRSDILIMHHATLTHLPLDHDFYEKAKNISDQLLSQRHHITTKPKFYSALLGDIMREVWEILVSHIVDKLMELGVQKQSRVWWCPTSFVANIPLHAAGPIPGKKKYFCDLYVSSYIPTLTALFNARMNQNCQGEGPISMLAISQLDESLPSVTAELEAIHGQANINVSVLENESATASAALQELENCSWIHFSCHGELAPNITEPFDAAFVLAGDSRLTLLDIVKAHLPHAQFAFLSACHTAELTEGSAMEEVLHLAAAMHFCGFPSVVGTMWQMMDEDAPFLAQEFYKYMFTTKETPETGLKRAARALNVATKALRKKGVGIERWANYIHIGI